MTPYRRFRPASLLAALAASSLVLAACGSGDSESATAPSSAPAVGAGTGSTQPAPAGDAVVPAGFAGASTVDGSTFDASALAGKPTVAWFWAPWCTICLAEGPDVAEVAAQYVDRVNFVGVGGRGEVSEMQRFVDETGTGALTHLADTSGDIWSAYEVFAQPAFAFITADGRVETFVGALGASSLSEIVEQLLAA